jgi:hypothetical protein
MEVRRQNNILSNFMAGITVAYTCFPIQGLKKWWQSRQSGITLTTWREYRLFRGSTVFAANVVPTTVIQLTTNSMIDAYLLDQSSTFYKRFFANALCGMCGAICSTLVENTIMRQQVLQKGPITALNSMFQESSLRPWRSYPLIATRDSIFTICMFCVLPEIKKISNANFPGDKTMESLSRFLVGFIGTAISHPFDTLATRIQLSEKSLTVKEAYNDCLKNLISSRGQRPIMCLYTGFIFRLLNFNIFSNLIPFVEKNTRKYLTI